MHQKSRAPLPCSAEQSGPHGSSVCGPRGVLATARVLMQTGGAQHSVLYVLNLGRKEKLTTDCDGSVYTENGRNDREHFDGSYRVHLRTNGKNFVQERSLVPSTFSRHDLAAGFRHRDHPGQSKGRKFPVERVHLPGGTKSWRKLRLSDLRSKFQMRITECDCETFHNEAEHRQLRKCFELSKWRLYLVQ